MNVRGILKQVFIRSCDVSVAIALLQRSFLRIFMVNYSPFAPSQLKLVAVACWES